MYHRGHIDNYRYELPDLLSKGFSVFDFRETFGDDIWHQLLELSPATHYNLKRGDICYGSKTLSQEFIRGLSTRFEETPLHKTISIYLRKRRPRILEAFVTRSIKTHSNHDTEDYHRDFSYGTIKLLVYLTDCETSEEAFSYVPGSHLIGTSKGPAILRRAVTTYSQDCSEHIERFYALPARWQQHSLTAFNLVDQDLIRSKHTRTVAILGKRGHGIVFDNQGIHAGGQGRFAERSVLQCLVG